MGNTKTKQFFDAKTVKEHRFLIEMKIDVNARYDHAPMNEYQTKLMIAVQTLSEDVVKFLLSKRADVNLQDHARRTALLQACHRRRVRIVKMLIDARANLELRGGYRNETALEMVSEKIMDGQRFGIYEDNALQKIADMLLSEMNRVNVEQMKKSLPLPIHGGHILLYRSIAEYLSPPSFQ